MSYPSAGPKLFLPKELVNLGMIKKEYQKIFLIKQMGKQGISSKYTQSPHNAHFGSWKKPGYSKIALVGLYCVFQLTRISPTSTYVHKLKSAYKWKFVLVETPLCGDQVHSILPTSTRLQSFCKPFDDTLNYRGLRIL